MFYHAYLRAGCCSLAAAAAGAVLRTARCCNTESYCKHGHSALSGLAFGPPFWGCGGALAAAEAGNGQRAKALDPRRYRLWPLWPLARSKGAPPSFPQFWESQLALGRPVSRSRSVSGPPNTRTRTAHRRGPFLPVRWAHCMRCLRSWLTTGATGILFYLAPRHTLRAGCPLSHRTG